MKKVDNIFHRTTCRLCGGKDLTLALKLAPSPLPDAYVPVEDADKPQPLFPLNLFLCRGCGFSQLLDVVLPGAIYTYYLYETKSSLGLVDHFKQYADEVLDRIQPARGSLVVDIGSNDGTLLSFFKKRGRRVLGIDPAVEIARKATGSGLETLPALFTFELSQRIKREWGPATIITANNLFANVDDLTDLTRGIRELLAPDGVFIFESSYCVDMIQNMIFDFIYHEHLSYFSVKPLNTFFHEQGMEIIDIQRISTKGGSLRYTVQLAGGPRAVSGSVAEFIELERRMAPDNWKFSTILPEGSTA